jgi:hypothetical protein
MYDGPTWSSQKSQGHLTATDANVYVMGPGPVECKPVAAKIASMSAEPHVHCVALAQLQ